MGTTKCKCELKGKKDSKFYKGVKSHLFKLSIVNLYNSIHVIVIQNIVHSQHASAWMKYVVVHKVLKYRT